VSGLLTGTAYPELTGTHEIVSTSGFVSEIDFSGKKMLGLSGSKNHVSAAVYDMNDRKKALYTIDGSWSDSFTIRDEIAGREVETYDCSVEPATMRVAPLEQQDGWESRRVWSGTINALNNGQMQAAADEKSKIEEGQRAMRKQEESDGKAWQPIFFQKTNRDARFERLRSLKKKSEDLETGLWVYDARLAGSAKRPYHGDLTPFNTNSFGQD